MTPRIFLTLVALTIAAVATALIAVIAQPTVTTVQVDARHAFPALNARPEAVAKITVESQAITINLDLAPDGTWVAADRANYPVRTEETKEILSKMADMRIVEAKTNRAERFARLELEDYKGKDAKSRLIKIFDAQGQLLAEAVMGRTRGRATGVQRTGTYLRRPNENQTWLASGDVNVPTRMRR